MNLFIVMHIGNFFGALFQIFKQVQQLRSYILTVGAIRIKKDLLRSIPQCEPCLFAVLFEHILVSSLSKRVKRTDENNVTGL